MVHEWTLKVEVFALLNHKMLGQPTAKVSGKTLHIWQWLTKESAMNLVLCMDVI